MKRCIRRVAEGRWQLVDLESGFIRGLYSDYLAARRAQFERPAFAAPYRALLEAESGEPPHWLLPEQRTIWDRTYRRILALTGDTTKAWLLALGMVKRQRQGMAIRGILEDSGDLMIGGWMILFGSPAFKDKLDTYFTKDTQYGLDYYPSAPLWYHHGADPAYGGEPIGVRAQAATYPEIGIWGEHRLFRSHRLFDRTLAEIEAGALAYSSDTLEHFVRLGFQQDGALLLWFLAGCSLTKSPAEPGLGAVVALESAEL